MFRAKSKKSSGKKRSWRSYRESIENILNRMERDIRENRVIIDVDSDDDVSITGTSNVVSLDSDDDDEVVEVYGVLRANIVGVRYYQGQVSNNEMVALIREPHNQYDRNAIRVDNMIGQQVGHIKREAAAVLAQIMDRKLCHIEGTVPFGANNVYSMPINLTFSGAAAKRKPTKDLLDSSGMVLKSGIEIGAMTGNKDKDQMSESQISQFARLNSLANPERTFRTQEQVKNELDKLFENLPEGDKLTTAEPAAAVKTSLYEHQQQALNWMICKERGVDLPPFWQAKPRNMYFNTLTTFTTEIKPKSVCGGILADDMGLGKTLTVIALIFTNFVNGKPLAVPVGMTKMSSSSTTSKRSTPNTAQSNRVFKKSGTNTRDKVKSSSKTSSARNYAVVDKRVSADCEVPADGHDPDFIPDNSPANETLLQRVQRKTKRPLKYKDYHDDAISEEENEIAPSKSKRSKSDKLVSSGRKSNAKPTENETVTRIMQPILPNNDDNIVYSVESLDDGTRLVLTRTQSLGAASDNTSVQSSIEQQTLDMKVESDNSVAARDNVDDTSQTERIDDEDELPDIVSSVSSTETTSSLSDDAPEHFYPPTGINGSGRTPTDGPRTTLIICPLSVLGNWLQQLDEHLHSTVSINVLTFYGPQRTKNSKLLEKQDIVLTTYSTLTADHKNERVLTKVTWLRVVLDEGHIIRNPNALQTKAIFEIKSHRKWILSGTPIQNSLKDLWTLVRFLEIEPFTEKSWWNRTIQRPVMAGHSSAIKRLQLLMANVSMRRTKTQTVNGKRLIQLPERLVYLEHVVLSAEERTVYDSMEKGGRIIIGRYFNQGTLLHHYGEVLAILLRLRQLCCHPSLVAKAVAKAIEKGAETTSDNRVEEPVDGDSRQKLIEQLMAVLSSGMDDDCSICLDSLTLPVITACAHVFCRSCIEAVMRSEKFNAKCPLCRSAIQAKDLVEVPSETADDAKTMEIDGDEWKSSSKVDALLRALVKLRDEDPSIKSLVVSQFTSLLTLIEPPLRHLGFKFARLDGTMNIKERTKSIAEFCSSSASSPTIFLLSLKAGGVGVNLTAASRVFLLDPAWNPATEEQCFDRCHRLGQVNDVIITKFVTDNSVETKMLDLQERKRKLMHGAFKKLSVEERRQMRINDITSLIDINRPQTPVT